MLGLVLTEYDVGTIPVSLDRVTCGSIDRVCKTGIPHLLVLGVNDGVLPSAGEGGGILSDSDRAQLLGLEVELETSEERMEQEQAALYRVLGIRFTGFAAVVEHSRRGWRKTTFVFGWRTAAIAQRSAGDERK